MGAPMAPKKKSLFSGGGMGRAMMQAARSSGEMAAEPLHVARIASVVGRDNLQSLQNAIKEGDCEVARSLIENGVHVDERLDSNGRTALMIAVEPSDAKMAELLVDFGASVTITDSTG